MISINDQELESQLRDGKPPPSIYGHDYFRFPKTSNKWSKVPLFFHDSFRPPYQSFLNEDVIKKLITKRIHDRMSVRGDETGLTWGTRLDEG